MQGSLLRLSLEFRLLLANLTNSGYLLNVWAGSGLSFGFRLRKKIVYRVEPLHLNPSTPLHVSKSSGCATWEFPKIRGTLFWGPYNKDPTI